MQPEDVKHLYDRAYAATYDARFLVAPNVKADTEHELKLLADLLQPGDEWLDVACGTGYFLRAFPTIRRVGVDLSPAMLERAAEGNRDVVFHEADFRTPRPEWNDRFGVVSCMWYAYTLVETIDEIDQVVANLADWTRGDGVCFVPLADARLIARQDLPYELHDGFAGEATLTGVVWSFSEDGGRKVHRHLVTPQIEYMIESFRRFFADVQVLRYPHKPDGVNARPALVARRKG